jgi:hypothetical protein
VEIKGDISSVSKEISALRKEVKLCDGILTRSETIGKSHEVSRMEMEIERRYSSVNNSEAADQVVSMSLKVLSCGEDRRRRGEKPCRVPLLPFKDQKMTKGKTRLQSMLRSGKELKVFAVRNEDCRNSVRRPNGTAYCTALADKKSADGLCDIMVGRGRFQDQPHVIASSLPRWIPQRSRRNRKSRSEKQEQKAPPKKGRPPKRRRTPFSTISCRSEKCWPEKEAPHNPNPTGEDGETPSVRAYLRAQREIRKGYD